MMRMVRARARVLQSVLVGIVVSLILAGSLQRTNAVTTLTAYQSSGQLTLDGAISPGEWNGAQITDIAGTGMTAAFEHNTTGLFMLLQWTKSTDCTNQYCFGGIEYGNLNNTGVMGDTSTPTVMLLLSQSFNGSYDEFISKAESTPTSVESGGYRTQSTCALGIVGGNYTAECYRPFRLADASPFDPFPSFAAGSPMEVAFAVGQFDVPGLHFATDMSTYTLVLSDSTFSSTSSTSATTSTALTTTPSTSLTTAQTQSTSTSSAPPYADELLVLTVGFTVLILVILSKYERS